MTGIKKSNRKLEILYLGDSEPDFEIILELMRHSEFDLRMDRVDNEKDYIDSLCNVGYDIILADFKLPGYNAFDALQKSLEICPDTPFIVVSGYIGEETAIELIKKGAVDYVLKNKPERLPFSIKRALDGAEDRKSFKRSQHELAKLSMAIEQNPVSIIITDKKGVIEYVNPKFTELTGYMPEEIIGKNPRILKSGKTSDEEYKILWETISSGKEWQGELINKKKNGDEYFEFASISPISDKNGTITHFMAVKEDISKRKGIEEALSLSEEKYRRIFENVQDVFYQVDNDGIITEISPSVFKLAGYTREELIGEQAVTFYNDPDDRYKMLKMLNKHEEILDFEVKLKLKNGQVKDSSINIHRIFDRDGNPIGIEGSIRDISDRKEYERALQRSSDELRELARHIEDAREEEKTKISLNLHDDLGQRLTAIKMEVSWLKLRIGVQPEVINNRIAELKRLIDDTIETIKKISSDLRPSVLRDLGISAAIEWQIKQFSVATGISGSFKIFPGDLTVDEKLSIVIFRIIQESLTNVVRHSKATKVTINLESETGKLKLYILDNGVGIEPEKIYDIKSFGLFSMRERARSYGGNITINGMRGIGTGILVTFPLEMKH